MCGPESCREHGAVAAGYASRTRGGSVSIFGFRKAQMVTADDALPGRSTAMQVPVRHEVLGTRLR